MGGKALAKAGAKVGVKLFKPAAKKLPRAADDVGKQAGKAGKATPKSLQKSARRHAEKGDPKLKAANKKQNREINDALNKANPKFKRGDPAYSQNCTGVTQSYELQRRGIDKVAGPLEKNLWRQPPAHNGPGGRSLSSIENTWGRSFTKGSKSEIDEAFKEPGSRGIVYTKWNGGGAHVYNVENVGGTVRYVDAQPNPVVQDASHYFAKGSDHRYVRLDDLPTPKDSKIDKYMEP